MTGYLTVAERASDPAAVPRQPARRCSCPGSLVFTHPAGPVDLQRPPELVVVGPGRSVAAPRGPGQHDGRRERHPVTQVAYEDATTFAAWAAKDLPSEAQWERAARGGMEGAVYSLGRRT